MQGIFHPNVMKLYSVPSTSGNLATIRVTRGETPGYLDPVLGWVPPTALVIYEGKARWQKIGLNTKRDNMSDFALFNRVRVVIAIAAMDAYDPYFDGFLPNDKIELIKNDANPLSEGSAVYYWGDPTSSLAWHYTLNTQQNMKQEG